MEEFNYKQTLTIDAACYKNIWRKKPSYRSFLPLMLLLAGGAMLFFDSTRYYGIAICCFISFFFVLTRISLFLGFSYGYKGQRYLHEPLEFRMNESSFSILGDRIELRSSWDQINEWEIRNDWLILRTFNLPFVYFKWSLIKEDGVLEEVEELIGKHGKGKQRGCIVSISR